MQTRLQVSLQRTGRSVYTLQQTRQWHRRVSYRTRPLRRSEIHTRASSEECARQLARIKDTSSKEDSRSSDWKLPVAGTDTDWREFRARLVAGESQTAPSENTSSTDEPSTSGREENNLWAHPIAQPEKGCLLLAHPLMFNSQQGYFHQSVILIISHDESGTAGIILNKPMDHLIGQLAGTEALAPEFSENRLFLGGDVGSAGSPNVMQLLHGQGQLDKTVEVVPGVYLGGFQASKKAVRSGELPASNFRWYCRYAGWAPGQLQAECDKGVWFTAAASSDLILHPCCLVNGRQHWHMVLQRMGGEYGQLSEALLVDKQAYEDVFGKSEYLETSQNPRKGDGEESN